MTIEIWKDGDRRMGICSRCERRTEVVFQRRDLKLTEPAVTAEDVLVAVCLHCDSIALIPNQSTSRLRHAIHRPEATLNVRIPGHLEDVLYMLAERLAPGRTSGDSLVFKYLLLEFGNKPRYAKRVREALNEDLAQGKADKEVSVLFPEYILVAVDQMAEIVGIDGRSDVVRGILAAAKVDVLDEQDQESTDSLRSAIAAGV